MQHRKMHPSKSNSLYGNPFCGYHNENNKLLILYKDTVNNTFAKISDSAKISV